MALSEQSENGFTLIEVLVAMVILAIGLLGIEALAIGSARSVALAERQSSYAVLAADSLESAMHQLRQGIVPTQFCQNGLRFGDRLSRSVDMSDGQLPSVTVRVLPSGSTLTAAVDTFSVTSSLFVTPALGGSPAGAPCA